MERITDVDSPPDTTLLRHFNTTSDVGFATGSERSSIASMKL